MCSCHTTMQSQAKVCTHLLEVHDHYLCKTSYCTALFKSAVQCESHYNDVHATGEDKAFKCDTCSKTFSRRAHLQEHALKHVSEEEREFYECPEEDCTLSFLREHDLAHHAKSHSESVWSCHLCEFVINEKCTLRKYVTQQHEEPKIPCCAGCTQKFKMYDACLCHERNQHEHVQFIWYRCFSIAFASNVVATVHMSQQVYFVFTMLIYFQLQLQNMPATQEGMPRVHKCMHQFHPDLKRCLSARVCVTRLLECALCKAVFVSQREKQVHLIFEHNKLVCRGFHGCGWEGCHRLFDTFTSQDAHEALGVQAVSNHATVHLHGASAALRQALNML